MEKFIQLLLGDNIDISTYAAAFVFALIGAIVSLRFKASKRDKLSSNTPYKFSWRFLIQDNLLQLITGLLLTFLCFRFTDELLGKELTMWLAVLIGFSFNEIAGLFEKLQVKARE